MHKQLIIMAALAASTLPVLQQAQAAQNLSSLMVEVRQQDGIPHYYNLASGMPLNGEISIVRDNQAIPWRSSPRACPMGAGRYFTPTMPN